jgi:hypothetical protein
LEVPRPPASLGKRVFYDPFRNRLLVRGYLNDRTLGKRPHGHAAAGVCANLIF